MMNLGLYLTRHIKLIQMDFILLVSLTFYVFIACWLHWVWGAGHRRL